MHNQSFHSLCIFVHFIQACIHKVKKNRQKHTEDKLRYLPDVCSLFIKASISISKPSSVLPTHSLNCSILGCFHALVTCFRAVTVIMSKKSVLCFYLFIIYLQILLSAKLKNVMTLTMSN